MRIQSLVIAALLTLSAPLLASDDDRTDHAEGKPSADLDQALANLSTYNAKLAALVEQDSLSPQQMHEVHMLTYTLENALERLEEEVEAMAEDLEAVHIASEHTDGDTVRTKGAAYLEASGKLTQ